MKVTRILNRIVTPGAVHLVVDPHDETCKGAHSISVIALPRFCTMDGGQMVGSHYYASLVWDDSGGTLSVAGSREFFEAGLRACEIAEQIARDGEYIE